MKGSFDRCSRCLFYFVKPSRLLLWPYRSWASQTVNSLRRVISVLQQNTGARTVVAQMRTETHAAKRRMANITCVVLVSNSQNASRIKDTANDVQAQHVVFMDVAQNELPVMPQVVVMASPMGCHHHHQVCLLSQQWNPMPRRWKSHFKHYTSRL